MRALPTTTLPIVVIGAGPVGLAAAAHLVQHDLTPLVLEAGTSVAANLASYRHVRLFSPWRYNLDHAARTLLLESGWQMPEQEGLPTAGALIDEYLTPLAALPALAPHIRFAHRVIGLGRQGFDKVKTQGRDAAPFVVRVHTPAGERDILARAVIDAAGTWSQPNPLGANGVPALGESDLAEAIAYGMPDILGQERARYAGQRVLVVGAGHSAAGNLLALAELATQEPGTTIVWATRNKNPGKVFGGGSADQLPARGLLGVRLRELQASGRLEWHADFRVHALRPAADGNGITVEGEAVDGHTPVIANIGQLVCATGARPDLGMSRELRLNLDSALESTAALAPLIDPNLHSCGTVRPHGHRELAHPETGYYTVGAKSYGRAPNFLMATGYEQVRSIVAALAGDLAAADDVRLELPETGVCNVSFASLAKGQLAASTGAEEACCGGPAPKGVDACCVQDADEKAQGKAGCGSNNAAPAPGNTSACCG